MTSNGRNEKNTYSIATPERFRADLRQTHVVEFVFLDKFCQRLDGFLDRDLNINPRTVKEINPFSPAEFLVDVINTSPQNFGLKRYCELMCMTDISILLTRRLAPMS